MFLDDRNYRAAQFLKDDDRRAEGVWTLRLPGQDGYKEYGGLHCLQRWQWGRGFGEVMQDSKYWTELYLKIKAAEPDQTRALHLLVDSVRERMLEGERAKVKSLPVARLLNLSANEYEKHGYVKEGNQSNPASASGYSTVSCRGIFRNA